MNWSVNPSTTKLFRVRKTVYKMLTKRGYAVSNEDQNMSLETFVSEVLIFIWWHLSIVTETEFPI